MVVFLMVLFVFYSFISVWFFFIFVFVFGFLWEVWEDMWCGWGDNELNNRVIEVYDGNGYLVEKKWKDLCVGDFVRVKDGDYFFFDLFLILFIGFDGICYVEIMNLDGEINLKVSFVVCYIILCIFNVNV